MIKTGTLIILGVVAFFLVAIILLGFFLYSVISNQRVNQEIAIQQAANSGSHDALGGIFGFLSDLVIFG